MKNQKNNLVRSPLHYNGNKFSIADQILEIINTDKSIIEIFGGTGIISINSSAKNIWINDNNKSLMELIKYIKNFTPKNESNLIKLTEKYKLTSDMNKLAPLRKNNGTKGYSQLNKKGYLQLKDAYNKKNDIEKLFLLINYSFNRMLRFNSKGEFNVPVGKGDWSNRQLKYLKEYQLKLQKKETKITSFNYLDILSKITTNDFVYIDPPYLNGTAQYNAFWGMEDELNLLKVIDSLNERGIDFALSNTLFSNGMLNVPLDNWIKRNSFSVYKIKKKYSKTSYNKKNRYDAEEVLVTNIKE
ncbi:Dam family site-specific DNA-(adenine-N6)-methyltransferase [Mycoplasma todarodis]|uniref:Dam family site-specific DNA-(adenine-N6)-methyltransferase n=1 Tax=Mycoplasma todarodis TaxID=1937191 RepID=UPI003B2F7CED